MPARYADTVGDYTWGVAFGTYFWVDPKEDMAVLYMAATHGRHSEWRRYLQQQDGGQPGAADDRPLSCHLGLP